MSFKWKGSQYLPGSASFTSRHPVSDAFQYPPRLLHGQKCFLEQSLETSDFRQLGNPGPLPPKLQLVQGSRHWREMNYSDLLLCLCENGGQWTQGKSQSPCMSKMGKAFDGDVHICSCWLLTIHSPFILVAAPQISAGCCPPHSSYTALGSRPKS